MEAVWKFFVEGQNDHESNIDYFSKLPEELIVQILFRLDVKDLVNFSMINKRFRNISDCDVIWERHYMNVVGSKCCETNRWKYLLDCNELAHSKQVCYKSKGNFKKCFLKDNQLQKKLADEKKKAEESDFLHKVKWIHDLPQKRITVACIIVFLLLLVFQVDEPVLPWFLVFVPLWMTFLLLALSIGSAHATKVRYPHLLFRLERGFFYRKIFKETTCCKLGENKTTYDDKTSNLQRLMKKRSLINMWYCLLSFIQCCLICYNLTWMSPIPWSVVMLPYLVGIGTYTLGLSLCECAPEGSKLGLGVAWASIPLMSFVASFWNYSASWYSAIIFCATIFTIWFISRFHNKNWWSDVIFRENLLNSWCLGSCIAGAFTFGIFLALKLDNLVSCTFFSVLTPVWFMDLALSVFSFFILQAPHHIYRLNKDERNSCILGNMFLLFPALLFQMWLYKRIDERATMSLFRLLSTELLLIICLVPVAKKFNLFL